jgi:UDP-2-acetamido-2,6-beta-L-arabino-hexul-4-ose reductase
MRTTSPRKHVDHRGFFQELLRRDNLGYSLDKVAQIGWFGVEPGLARGGHWHKTLTEIFVLLEGTVTATLETRDGIKSRFLMSNSNFADVLIVPPQTKHMFEGGTQGAKMLVLSDRLFDAENPDTFIGWDA